MGREVDKGTYRHEAQRDLLASRELYREEAWRDCPHSAPEAQGGTLAHSASLSIPRESARLGLPGLRGHLSLWVLSPHLKPSKGTSPFVQPKQTVPLGSKAPDKCQFCPQEAMVNGNLDVPQWGQGHRG